jgi:hypothetical protein
MRLLGVLVALYVLVALLAAVALTRPASSSSTCTMVVGYSVTRDWFSTGSFETQPGISNANWELLWDGGASPNRIAYGESGKQFLWPVWDSNGITSRCTVNDRLPDRIIYQVGYRWQSEVGQVQPVLDVVALLRSRINPSAEIYLMGQIGSTTPDTCAVWGDDVAAGSITAIKGAIAADPSLREAVHPKVLCSQFSDSNGHLSSAGAASAASQVANWVASLGAPPPTATATPTATPAPCGP